MHVEPEALNTTCCPVTGEEGENVNAAVGAAGGAGGGGGGGGGAVPVPLTYAEIDPEPHATEEGNDAGGDVRLVALVQ